MKPLITFLLGMMLFVAAGATQAASLLKDHPVIRIKTKPIPPASLQYILQLTPRSYKKATGITLHLGDKIALRLYQWKLRKQLSKHEDITKREKTLGLWSLILSAAAFVFVFIPVFSILSVPSAITGVILGIMSLKNNKNTNGILGIVLGGLFLLALIVVVAAFVTGFR